MSEPRLTYCGNVHPAPTLDSWLEQLTHFGQPLAEHARDSGHRFGLGIWWPDSVTRELVASGSGPAASSVERVRAALARSGLEIWTANVFPFQSFHAESVKTAVYRPDWSTSQRADYTVRTAEALALCTPEGAELSLSTLPLGYRDGDRRIGDLPDAEQEALADRLRATVRRLAEVSDRSGRSFKLALEPEPFCLLERVSDTAGFLESRVFRGAPDEARLRSHLGVCIDLCHLEVVGEDPLAALAQLRARGIEVSKVQVSSCLELREAAGLEALLEFAEPRYLHQTVGAAGARALDLSEVGESRQAFSGGFPVRSHYHLPVFWDQIGPLGSTRASVERFLIEAPGPLPLLEVETYTWSVLDAGSIDSDDRAEQFRSRNDRAEALSGHELVRGLARELEFVRGVLARRD